MERNIAHIDLDSFFVSVERLQNSTLNGRPVIVGGTSDRGVVSACSYEARAFGVHSAMPMKLAKRLCSDAVFVRGDMDLYTRYSRLVTDLVSEKVPLFEKASIDEFYIDVSGMDRFFGCFKWMCELRKDIINEIGLPVSFGLSVNKTVSKIATGESKPNGQIFVKKDQVKQFLYPLSIKKIPMVGPKTYQLLSSMGVMDIKTLSEIPPQMMQSVMGKNGMVLWQKANGLDNTAVKPYFESKSLGTERTFEKDSIDIEKIKSLLLAMTEKLGFKLRKKNNLTSVVTVKIKYANFDTHTLQKKISYTAFDHVLIDVVLQLFEKLYQRRMLIRLVGVRFSGLVNGVQQIDMFEDTLQQISLCQAMDGIRKKYGDKAVRRAVAG